jgi:hypothetical protein
MDLLADLDDNNLWPVGGVDLRTSGVLLFPELSSSSSDHETGSSLDSDEFVPQEQQLSDDSSEPAPVASPTKRGRKPKQQTADSYSSSSSSKEEKEPTSRKRKTVLEATDSITLSRDVLLTISSEEFEELVANISSSRRLTDAEHKEVRRQKRLIKNRESAALSRNRKKQALETLEAENAKLRDELSMMKKFLQQTNQLGAYVSSLATPMGSSRGSTAGLMLVLVLSFGLFVNFAALRPMMAGRAHGSGDVAGPQPNLRQLFSLSSANTVLLADEVEHLHAQHQINSCNISTVPVVAAA